MSTNVYPAGSQHQNKDVWQSLPRVDMGIAERDWRDTARFFTGCFWAFILSVFIDGAMGLVILAIWMLSR
jgi:hypothetical protein